jgi:hypothetical protein
MIPMMSCFELGSQGEEQDEVVREMAPADSNPDSQEDKGSAKFVKHDAAESNNVIIALSFDRSVLPTTCPTVPLF